MKPATCLLSLSTALLLSTAAGAQDQSIQGSFSRSIGDSNARAYVGADGAASLSRDSYLQNGIQEHAFDMHVETHAAAGAQVFGVTAEAFRFDAEASMADDSGSASGTQGSASRLLRVGGSTYYAAGEFDLTWQSPRYSSRVLNANRNFYLALGVTLNVRATADVTAELDVTLNANPFEHQVRLTATPHVTLRGAASASFNAYLLRAGIWASLNLLDMTLETPVVADLEDGLSGDVIVATQPVSVSMVAYLDRGTVSCARRVWGVCYWWRTGWSRVITLPLVSWSSSPFQQTIPLF